MINSYTSEATTIVVFMLNGHKTMMRDWVKCANSFKIYVGELKNE